jgi:hypothetical protein
MGSIIFGLWGQIETMITVLGIAWLFVRTRESISRVWIPVFQRESFMGCLILMMVILYQIMFFVYDIYNEKIITYHTILEFFFSLKNSNGF